MKIAFVLTAIDNLGPFIVIRDIIKNIVSKTEKIDIYYLKEPQSLLNFEAGTTKISFFTAIDFSEYDVVHSTGFLADLYVSVHRTKKTQWVSTLHQKIQPNYRLDYNNLIATTLEFVWLSRLKKAACVTTLTKEMRDYYLPKFKGKKLMYVYNGIEENKTHSPIPESELAAIQTLKKDHHLLGIIARLVFLKGIDQVIKALPQAKGYALLIIGDGIEKDNLLELAKTLKVEDRCLFVGYKAKPTDYLGLMDLYVMSSRTEGFGLSVIEAASQHIPVICNDLPVYRELFTDDEIVRFELENLDSMVKSFDYAIQHKKILAQRIYQKYNNTYTASKMSEAFFSVYITLTNKI
jgi:glycosyltransferase involved in cell wall biosynthesis